jgi:hypothetical protein
LKLAIVDIRLFGTSTARIRAALDSVEEARQFGSEDKGLSLRD